MCKFCARFTWVVTYMGQHTNTLKEKEREKERASERAKKNETNLNIWDVKAQ